MIINKYSYQPLKRQQVEGSRLYLTPEGHRVASVTTILDATKSAESRQALQNWRNRVGHQRAQEITTEAAGRGTRMHKYLEDYVRDGVLRQPGSNPYSQQSQQMADVVIREGLINVSEYWGLEVGLYYPELYAGTTDCVGVWRDQPAILDFKQTNKPKKREWIEDYFCQIAAYALAHNRVYNTDINTGVILMCSKDMQFQHWVIEGAEFEHYTQQWLNRVAEFYQILDK